MIDSPNVVSFPRAPLEEFLQDIAIQLFIYQLVKQMGVTEIISFNRVLDSFKAVDKIKGLNFPGEKILTAVEWFSEALLSGTDLASMSPKTIKLSDSTLTHLGRIQRRHNASPPEAVAIAVAYWVQHQAPAQRGES